MRNRQDFQEMTQEGCYRGCLPDSIHRKALRRHMRMHGTMVIILPVRQNNQNDNEINQ